MSVQTKNIYEPVEPVDGCRILVMRFWPRGISKDKIDIWEKDLGTPADLIKKWKSNSISWRDFSKQYHKYVSEHEDKIEEIAHRSKKETVTLLCSCRDDRHCHRYLLEKLIEKAINHEK
jgi:uncharacterized protein YeaO (DUF488 family)